MSRFRSVEKHVGVDGIFTKAGHQHLAGVMSLPQFRDDFLGQAGDTLLIPWSVNDVSATGTPTVDFVADARWGRYGITLAATGEAENVCLYWGDQLMIPFEPGLVVEMRVIPQTIPTAAGEAFLFGLSSNIPGTPAVIANWDANTVNCWFRAEANGNLLAEVDDAVTNDDDNDTGVDLVNSTAVGLRIEVPDLSHVNFWVDSDWDDNDDANWDLVQVLSMAGLQASNELVQPVIVANKDSGTGQPSFHIDHFAVYNVNKDAR